MKLSKKTKTSLKQGMVKSLKLIEVSTEKMETYNGITIAKQNSSKASK
jgi:hypothetical protein